MSDFKLGVFWKAFCHLTCKSQEKNFFSTYFFFDELSFCRCTVDFCLAFRQILETRIYGFARVPFVKLPTDLS